MCASCRGTLRISPAHSFDRETLTVRLLTRQLQASTMTVDEPPISTVTTRPE